MTPSDGNRGDHARGGFPDGVPGTRFARVDWVDETGSTNADLLAAASAGAAEGLALVADHQRAGRGRLGRVWQAPPGASLLVSVLLRPQMPADRLFLLTLAAGLAAAEAVESLTGVRLGLKWPNDLVVVDGPLADRKVAGILAETHVAGGRVGAVVVGMGLNVDWPDDVPADLAEVAASLDRLAPVISRSELLVQWLVRYESWLVRLEQGDDVALLDAVRERSATLGRRVLVETADGTFDGVAVEVDADGSLRVRTDDGDEASVCVGDVVHARLHR